MGGKRRKIGEDKDINEWEEKGKGEKREVGVDERKERWEMTERRERKGG